MRARVLAAASQISPTVSRRPGRHPSRDTVHAELHLTGQHVEGLVVGVVVVSRRTAPQTGEVVGWTITEWKNWVVDLVEHALLGTAD